MTSFLKIYLPSFVLLFILLVFIFPSVKVYRQTGINPFRFKTGLDNAHDFVGGSIKSFIVFIVLIVTIHSYFPLLYQYTAPFKYLEHDNLIIFGLVLGHVSLVCIMIAQQHMRQSWRIGIDYEHSTPLVTKGFFKYSRNPIYLFLLSALAGLFLIIPNAITFAVNFSAYLVLQISIRLEEEFLEKQHGKSYLDYKIRVRRLI